MPRNDLKPYETLTARMPQDLVDAARRYASLHRCTVAELLREGLEMRLEAEAVPGRGSPHAEVRPEVIHEVIQALEPRIQAWLQAARTPSPVEVRPEVRPHSTPAGEGHTEVIPQRDDYDPTKFYLGKLCKRGHEYQGTGKTLLRKSNQNCQQCLNEQKRERRARHTAVQTEA